MNVIPRAIDLNNLAVARLQADRSSEAIQLFRVALADVKDAFSQRYSSGYKTTDCHQESSAPPPSEPQLAPTLAPMETEEPGVVIAAEDIDHDDSIVIFSADYLDPLTHHEEGIKPATLLSTPLRSQHTTVQEVNHPLDHSFILMFDRAFCIDDDYEDEDELMSAVILYNMALVNHARGINHGTDSYLSNALQLYEMALNLLENMSVFPAEAALLLLALYNNLAHIYSHRFAVQPTRQFLDLLHQVMQDLALPTIDEEDFALFCLNALVYESNRDFALAPAA